MESTVGKGNWKSLQLENLGVGNPLIMTVAMGHFYKNEALAGTLRKNTNMLFYFLLTNLPCRINDLVSIYIRLSLCHLLKILDSSRI